MARPKRSSLQTRRRSRAELKNERRASQRFSIASDVTDHAEYLEQRARQCQQVEEGLIRRAASEESAEVAISPSEITLNPVPAAGPGHNESSHLTPPPKSTQNVMRVTSSTTTHPQRQRFQIIEGIWWTARIEPLTSALRTQRSPS